MAHVISNECIACGSCEAQCPVNAISMGDGKYEINPDECIDCGACEAQCPVGAISVRQYLKRQTARVTSEPFSLLLRSKLCKNTIE